jgi:aspartyl aminopeptidase
MARTLTEQGFTRLDEGEKWTILPGQGYFVTRNDSSLIAFQIPNQGIKGWRIMASHSDSPAFKIKEHPEITVENHYVQLNVEKYGGLVVSSWLDRPLSVAGRIIVRNPNHTLTSKLVNIDRDLVLIPNLAIHVNRDINKGYVYNPQIDLLPLFGMSDSKDSFWEIIAQSADCNAEDILGHDLFLYNRQKGAIWGGSGEFLSCGRLDDLHSAYGSLQGFLAGEKREYAAIHCVFDNEEVGSYTKQGAASTFLADTMIRISDALSMSREEYLISLSNSFMVSADSAHAVHPNHPAKSDPTNRPYLNEGIVIKYNGEQKYCSDARSAAIFKNLCMEAGIPFQTFANRSDAAGGATLGNISSTQVSINTVDIGLPLLAMHTPYETAGIKDTAYLIQAAKAMFA